MPGTVDDFMNRFGGGGTIDDSDAQQLHDRFVSTNPDDRAFDNQTYNQSATEYLGKLPDDQFQDAARSALQQGRTPGPAGIAGRVNRRARRRRPGDIASKLGLASTDPSKMSADDAARLMNYARTEKPEVLQKTVQEKPWFVKAMGNPVIMGVLAVAAAKMIGSQKR